MPKVEGYETERQHTALTAECARLSTLYDDKLARYRMTYNAWQLSGEEGDAHYATTLYRQANTILQAWRDTQTLATHARVRAEQARHARLRSHGEPTS